MPGLFAVDGVAVDQPVPAGARLAGDADLAEEVALAEQVAAVRPRVEGARQQQGRQPEGEPPRPVGQRVGQHGEQAKQYVHGDSVRQKAERPDGQD